MLLFEDSLVQHQSPWVSEMGLLVLSCMKEFVATKGSHMPRRSTLGRYVFSPMRLAILQGCS